MRERFFTKKEFDEELKNEIQCAQDVYKRRINDGMFDGSIARYDFSFISDTEEKIKKLAEYLKDNYGFNIENLRKRDEYFEVTGKAIDFPVKEEYLLYWVLNLYYKGYEFDCKFDAYGAFADANNQNFLELKRNDENLFFEQAMEAYNKDNFGMAFIYFSTVIEINPNDPNAWYSRAIIRDELHTSKSARKDYDTAIKLAPDFTDAILNRAVNKDNAGEYWGAIDDYNKVIELAPNDPMAYFNRGNTKYNLNDKDGACNDWHKAKELGADYAKIRIEKVCKKS